MDTDQNAIDEFFKFISPWETCYSEGGLGYFGVIRGKEKHLLQARLYLNPWAHDARSRTFSSANTFAGYVTFTDLRQSPEIVVANIREGWLEIDGQKVVFPKENGNRVSAHLAHNSTILGPPTGSRVTTLTLSGAQRHNMLDFQLAEWELRAAEEPFDSIADLLGECDLGVYRGDFAHVDVVAFHVVEVNLAATVRETTANPGIHLARSLDRTKARLGYRIFHQGRIVRRGSIRGDELVWEEHKRSPLGSTTLEVPEGAVVQCFGSYDGVAQSHGWIANPSYSQNPRRAAYDEVDPGTAVLRDFLFEEKRVRKESRDFEAGVAWLLWMRGFSPMHANTKRVEEGPDIVAFTPKNNVIVVECTIGVVNENNKLSKLVSRATSIKRRLERSGYGQLNVLPIIISALSKAELVADLDQAKKLGVLVFAKEDLAESVESTIVPADPDLLFSQSWELVKTAS